jgi:hypothetical protein
MRTIGIVRKPCPHVDEPNELSIDMKSSRRYGNKNRPCHSSPVFPTIISKKVKGK